MARASSSYFYHRTVPFESAEAEADARISIAFDMLPEG